jgi:hypothetical protein
MTLTVTAWCLADILIEAASLAGDTSEESLARFPDDCMRSTSRKAGSLCEFAAGTTAGSVDSGGIAGDVR